MRKNVFKKEKNNDDKEQSNSFSNCQFTTLMVLSGHLQGIVSL